MYHASRFFVFSFFFAFFAIMSVWTHPHGQFRKIASSTPDYQVSFYYDASYKL
jgi:uncharacterized membrane protein